jgi:HSP20 family molecular chaperone IbpA
MNTLMPRFFGDIFDWIETETPIRPSLIKIEDRQTDNEYFVRAELPGVDPQKDVQLTLDHGVLTIQCEREEQKQEHDRTEFRYGVLQRSIRLPGNAKEDKVTAKYSNGILEVKIPLAEHKVMGRQVPIAITGK